MTSPQCSLADFAARLDLVEGELRDQRAWNVQLRTLNEYLLRDLASYKAGEPPHDEYVATTDTSVRANLDECQL